MHDAPAPGPEMAPGSSSRPFSLLSLDIGTRFPGSVHMIIAAATAKWRWPGAGGMFAWRTDETLRSSRPRAVLPSASVWRGGFRSGRR